MRLILVTTLFVSSVLVSCGGSEDAVETVTAEERFDRGMAEFEDEDYLDAITQFETLLLQDPASDRADDAQFYLAESYYRDGEYFTAAFQYSRVLTDFRGSPYYKRALFMTGECYYEVAPKYQRDQKRTERAISQYEAFIGYFPNDSLTGVARERISDLREKLAQRDYSVAEGYFARNEYEAAAIYFQRVVDRYPETTWSQQAAARLGDAQARAEMDK